MNTDTAFKPFVPPEPMFEEGKDADTTKTPTKPKRKRKKSTKKRAQPKAAIPPAPKHVRPTRKKAKARKPRTARGTVYAVKGRKVIGKTRALKLDITSAMAISAMLKPADFKMFESLTETLQSVNKATRKRLLTAIGKVFG